MTSGGGIYSTDEANELDVANKYLVYPTMISFDATNAFKDDNSKRKNKML